MVGARAALPRYTRVGQRAALWSQFSPSPFMALGTQLCPRLAQQHLYLLTYLVGPHSFPTVKWQLLFLNKKKKRNLSLICVPMNVESYINWKMHGTPWSWDYGCPCVSCQPGARITGGCGHRWVWAAHLMWTLGIPALLKNSKLTYPLNHLSSIPRIIF